MARIVEQVRKEGWTREDDFQPSRRVPGPLKKVRAIMQRRSQSRLPDGLWRLWGGGLRLKEEP